MTSVRSDRRSTSRRQIALVVLALPLGVLFAYPGSGLLWGWWSAEDGGIHRFHHVIWGMHTGLMLSVGLLALLVRTEEKNLLVNIDVPDIEEGIRFYTAALGFRLARRLGARRLELRHVGSGEAQQVEGADQIDLDHAPEGVERKRTVFAENASRREDAGAIQIADSR